MRTFAVMVGNSVPGTHTFLIFASVLKLIGFTSELDYPDERSDDELDYYRATYEDDYEREMLEKFEKVKTGWNNDASDYSDTYDD